MKHILAINGSASDASSNQKLIDFLKTESEGYFRISVFDQLKSLPHFDPANATKNTPQPVLDFRQAIESADAVLICTPEYVFSLPSGLKNALEWCVATTVFSEKPLGIITASASGIQGHEELQRIMRTLMARFVPNTTLLIQGIKARFSPEGTIQDEATRLHLLNFLSAFRVFLQEEIHPES
ncbi:MAG: NAD(P)H-dependent oxidoreductase [Bacteroidetes bacterium]|nr:NAD(P)H-dependent oxidoreductase [Bacteroidota bacterium]